MVNSFNYDQLSQLQLRTLRDIICENTGIEALQEDVFRLGGEEKDCRTTNSINFDLFV